MSESSPSVEPTDSGLRPPAAADLKRSPSMAAHITRIAEIHAQGFHACLDAVAREKKYLAQVEALPLERVQQFVQESVANNAAQFVALDGPVVVGWCDVFPAWAAAVKHCGSLGMGVHSAHRGQGIGKQLLAATIAHAQRNGITRVELEVREDNAAAIRLYESAGFVHEGRKRNGMRFDGQYFDTLVMSLVHEEG